MRPLTVGSLFSGIGGLELGLERAGMRVVWQVEKDDYCRRVLAKHWPDVERFEDVKEVGAHNLSPVDLICGGFPCQDISPAGQKAGIEGDRSGLWSEYARIVCELRPRYILVENVTALLSRGLDTVLGDLAEVGYDAEWDCIPASHFGAPIGRQGRDRIWIVAYPNSGRFGRAGLPRRPEGQLLAGVTGRDRTLARISGAASHYWHSEPDVGRVAHGVPSRVDRLRALGNAVVPQVSEYIGRLIVEADQELNGAA